MLPQIFVSLKFFILSLLAVYKADNPHFCPPVLKTVDDYQSCHLKALYDYNQCRYEQIDCFIDCANFASEAYRFGFIDQPLLTSVIKKAVEMLSSHCNSICKDPYSYEAGWHCLDRKRDEEQAWLNMRWFETDKRTEKQKKEDSQHLLVWVNEQLTLDEAGFDYILANPEIYLQTLPKQLTPQELESLRYRPFSDESQLSDQEKDKLWARIDERNSYIKQKAVTDQIEAMIKYWESHTDFATKYLRPECPLLSKKSKNQCIQAFVDSLQHQAYLHKRSKVMHELQRLKLQHKAVSQCAEQITKTKIKNRKKTITAPARKKVLFDPVYFIGETPQRLYLKQQARPPKNKAQFKLAHR